MQYSIINYSEAAKLFDFRLDAEYWHPEFIKNSLLISNNRKISDFVDSNIANIKSSPINRDFEYLEISNISFSNYKTTRVKQGEEPDRAHYILAEKDIAVSTVRPNRNAVAFIKNKGVISSSGLSILRAKSIEPEYLYVFCKTNYFIRCLVRANKATMYPAVSNFDVTNIPILILSQSFRIKIREIIKRVFVYIRKSEEKYIQTQNLLLSELGLTNWQIKHQLTFAKNYSSVKQANRVDAEYYQPKYEEIEKAIKNYSGGWDTLGNLVSIKKCIEVGSAEYLDEGIPFVRVSNLSPFEINEEKYISEKLYQEVKRHQPERGEILLSKDATPGIAYYISETPQKMIPSSGILRLKIKSDKVNDEYLTLVLNSILIKEQVNRDIGGSVILHWRTDQVSRIAVPILSKSEQNQVQRIVAESFNLRKKSKHLLECAKQTVEVAIEQDEKEAISWLEKQTDVA